MFFDEEMILDLRLNIMDKYVDKFVITEATYMHSGEPKKLVFDINKFSKFKDKIIYIVVDEPPKDLIKINHIDDLNEKETKKTLNAKKREVFQINKTQEGLNNTNPEDIVIVSDVDEIPDLDQIDLRTINKKLIFFKQKIYFYKFNLHDPSTSWFGSRACRKKNFISPQWLRDIKTKKYPFWRIDTFFSKKKYNNIEYINDGGWHFTNIKTPENIQKKLLNYTHHDEFEKSGINLDQLKIMIKEKKAIYNHSVDQKQNKWNSKNTLHKVELNRLPDYLRENYKKYSSWIEF